ncbi:glycosyltransferase family 4 protein [uncultured Photobacterium sp.]|uniref:glycosyltransferase family 4 protein n=1 Tax=uncultured Photobacterium sp. TaxID=173973 RepID=UPI002609D76B|nr:glycosyltransferase family 4 protein [uncultured Photobacterium sp.]
MKRKIIIFSKEYPPEVGGAGVIAKTIYDGLSKVGDIKVSLVRLHNILDKCLFPLFFMNFLRADYIILNDLFSKKFWIKFLKLSLSRKCIIYLHGSEPEYLVNDIRYRKDFLNLCLYSKIVISVSDYMKIKFIESIPDDFEGKDKIISKIVIIKNGIDTGIFYNDINLKRCSNKLLITTTSRIIKEKGYIRMADIIKIYISKYSEEVEWSIVGDGKDIDLIKNYCKEIDIYKFTTFHGVLSHKLLFKLYNRSHAFLLLSELKESLGLVYMEASSCGAFSLGYNRYGVKEAIVNNISGKLINNESNDEIAFILNDIYCENKISNIEPDFFSKDNMLIKLNNYMRLHE